MGNKWHWYLFIGATIYKFSSQKKKKSCFAPSVNVSLKKKMEKRIGILSYYYVMASRRCCVSRSKNQLCVKGEILFVQMTDIRLLFLFKILLYYTRRVVICSRLNDDEIHLQKSGKKNKLTQFV